MGWGRVSLSLRVPRSLSLSLSASSPALSSLRSRCAVRASESRRRFWVDCAVWVLCCFVRQTDPKSSSTFSVSVSVSVGLSLSTTRLYHTIHHTTTQPITTSQHPLSHKALSLVYLHHRRRSRDRPRHQHQHTGPYPPTLRHRPGQRQHTDANRRDNEVGDRTHRVRHARHDDASLVRNSTVTLGKNNRFRRFDEWQREVTWIRVCGAKARIAKKAASGV